MEVITRIGIILAFVLAALLAVLLIVLLLMMLVPVRYESHDEYHEKKLKSDFDLKWLWGLIRIRIHAENELQIEKRFFGKEIKTSKTKETEKKLKKSDEEKTKEEKEPLTVEKIADTIKSGYKELKKQENQKLFKLIVEQCIKIIKHIFPEKISGNVVFGFENPADTGQMLANLAWLYPLFGDNFKIRPDFENKCLEGEADVEGKIGIGYCLFTSGRVWFNKDFRRFLCQIKSRN